MGCNAASCALATGCMAVTTVITRQGWAGLGRARRGPARHGLIQRTGFSRENSVRCEGTFGKAGRDLAWRGALWRG